MKNYFVLTWQYWKTNDCCWGYVAHIFTDKQARQEMFDNLCPCVHEYPCMFEQEYSNEQIASGYSLSSRITASTVLSLLRIGRYQP